MNTSVLVPTGDMAGPMTPEQAAAAAWMPFAALSRPSPYLLRCLLLAVLLHVWLVLLLGNAPGGTAPRGQGAWGSINITLRGPQSPGATAEQAPPEPLPPSGPAGTAIQPRFGGAVREAGPAPAPEPGAAQLGTWTATPLPFKPSSDLPSAASPTPRVDSNQASSGPPPTQGRVVEERATELPATKPGPIPIPAPPPAPMPAAEPAPTPTAERSLSSNIDRDSNRPTQVQPLNSNPVDNPSLRPLSLPARLPDLAAPLPAAPAVPPPPAPVPTAPPAPPAPAAPPPAATVVAPPTPAAVVEAPSVVRSLSTADTPSAPAAVAPLSRDVEGTAAPSLPPLQRPPAVGPALLAPPGGVAAPNAGPTVGADVATSAAQPASAPRLNLQLNRARGAELSRGASSGVLQLLPRPPDLPNKLAKDIEKTAKPDCKNAYAGAGLLAVVPLLLDAARQDGCKW